jgi:hypothetical protein
MGNTEFTDTAEEPHFFGDIDKFSVPRGRPPESGFWVVSAVSVFHAEVRSSTKQVSVVSVVSAESVFPPPLLLELGRSGKP